MVTRAELNSLIRKIEVVQDEEGKSISKRIRTKRGDYKGNGHWNFPEELGHGYYGFIYVIRNLLDNRAYIGKKFYVGHGKLNKGIVSNWQWYISSSKELSADIQLHGKENFEFIALEQYKTRGALGYAETWSMMMAEVPSNQHIWYNRLVTGISWVVKEPITDRHKQRLNCIIEGKPLTAVVLGY